MSEEILNSLRQKYQNSRRGSLVVMFILVCSIAASIFRQLVGGFRLTLNEFVIANSNILRIPLSHFTSKNVLAFGLVVGA